MVMNPSNQGSLSEDLAGYRQWCAGVSTSVDQFCDWLSENAFTEKKTIQDLRQITAQVREDRIYVAFVAEFSRGKSELINATFFSDLKQRVLPATAGRTTMCPTELRYDPAFPPSIRLLPIETRATDISLSDYRNREREWISYTLPLDDANELAKVLERVADTNRVTSKQADELGLDVEANLDAESQTLEDRIVMIPKWRHAIINYPHPMLEQGMVVLDTPGLNALGAEPELTFGMLASAQAVVFVLAADTGVTKSDLGVWREHVCSTLDNETENKLVVLNKIDVLWDELRNEQERSEQIQKQIQTTSSTLGIGSDRVYPLSAQKALLGRVKNDEEILHKSGIVDFEDALSSTLIPAKRQILQSRVREQLSGCMKQVHASLKRREIEVAQYTSDLMKLGDRSEDATMRMMMQIHNQKKRLEQSFRNYQSARSDFTQRSEQLLEMLDLKALDDSISDGKNLMISSLTTGGIKKSMRNFIDLATVRMKEVSAHAKDIQGVANALYRKFEEQHGMRGTPPPRFSTSTYTRELQSIAQHHETFVKGFSTAMTEQQLVARKYYQTVMARIRRCYVHANQNAQAWLNRIMTPLETEIREQKAKLRKRLDAIKRVHMANEGLKERKTELDEQTGLLERQLTELKQHTNNMNVWFKRSALHESRESGAEIVLQEKVAAG